MTLLTKKGGVNQPPDHPKPKITPKPQKPLHPHKGQVFHNPPESISELPELEKISRGGLMARLFRLLYRG